MEVADRSADWLDSLAAAEVLAFSDRLKDLRVFDPAFSFTEPPSMFKKPAPSFCRTPPDLPERIFVASKPKPPPLEFHELPVGQEELDSKSSGTSSLPTNSGPPTPKLTPKLSGKIVTGGFSGESTVSTVATDYEAEIDSDLEDEPKNAKFDVSFSFCSEAVSHLAEQRRAGSFSPRLVPSQPFSPRLVPSQPFSPRLVPSQPFSPRLVPSQLSQTKSLSPSALEQDTGEPNLPFVKHVPDQELSSQSQECIGTQKLQRRAPPSSITYIREETLSITQIEIAAQQTHDREIVACDQGGKTAPSLASSSVLDTAVQTSKCQEKEMPSKESTGREHRFNQFIKKFRKSVVRPRGDISSASWWHKFGLVVA